VAKLGRQRSIAAACPASSIATSIPPGSFDSIALAHRITTPAARMTSGIAPAKEPGSASRTTVSGPAGTRTGYGRVRHEDGEASGFTQAGWHASLPAVAA
jgi:hypothetical protein